MTSRVTVTLSSPGFISHHSRACCSSLRCGISSKSRGPSSVVLGRQSPVNCLPAPVVLTHCEGTNVFQSHKSRALTGGGHITSSRLSPMDGYSTKASGMAELSDYQIRCFWSAEVVTVMMIEPGGAQAHLSACTKSPHLPHWQTEQPFCLGLLWPWPSWKEPS